MKKSIIRVSLAFATLSDEELRGFCVVIVLCLTGNALFPNLPVTVAELTAFQSDFEKKMADADLGNHRERVAKDEARAALVIALRQIAAYVQSLNLASEADVLSSGFEVVRGRRSPTPATLSAPQLIGLDNTVSTQFTVRLRPVDFAHGYEVQYCSGSNPWSTGGVFHSTRNMFLTNLAPGTVYNVRIRAIGGLTGYSEWSASLSLMAT